MVSEIGVLAEPFTLKRTESGIVETDISVLTGEGNQIIWEYPVPVGFTLIFSPDHTFSVYLENSAAAEAGAGSLVDIVIFDADKRGMRTILNEVRYAQVKEFQDITKLVHLDIDPGKIIKATEGQRVCIRGNINGVLDASDSYFALKCDRVRMGLFE